MLCFLFAGIFQYGVLEYGVLEDDEVHKTRKRVFILNNNIRFCLYGSSSGTVAGKSRKYGNGHRPVQQSGMAFG